MTTKAPTLTVALVGNPNTGKSTLFNALSGLRQRVGNYPGVTVELKKGTVRHGERVWELIDLPGTYSLAPRSPDEMVAVDLLLGRHSHEPAPDVIISLVDATNLERHLYLTTQLFDLGRPVVLAVNMIDMAAAQGLQIDYAALSQRLGVPVVPIQANKGVGLDELQRAVEAAAEKNQPPPPVPFPEPFEQEVAQLRPLVGEAVPPFLLRRALLDVGGSVESDLIARGGEAVRQQLHAARERLAAAQCPIPAIEARTRYAYIRSLLHGVVAAPPQRVRTWTDRIDQILTHRLWGTLIFLALMFLMFQSIFRWARPAMDLIDSGREAVSAALQNGMPEGPLRSLLVDGVIKGVGAVLIFLPQIVILFGFIAVLEDCGYMARAAFLMDRLMSRCGLSGKSFIPLLSSLACAVPGILATRVIENTRDRLATILIAPLMSCSARLPVYVLLIGAFLREGYPSWLPGVVLFAMYLVGFTVAPLVAWTLKRTLLRGDTPSFVLELPPYRRPHLGLIFRRMYDAGRAFVVRAGTIILAAMILVWALLYFPDADAQGRSYPQRIAEAEAAVEELQKQTSHEAAGPDSAGHPPQDAVTHQILTEPKRLMAEWKRQSWLGRMGLALEPVFRPLGWDWKLGMAVLASFPAREVVVGTLGLIYEVGDVDPGAIAEEGNEETEQTASLLHALRQEWASDPVRGRYPIAVALSLMVFFALCCQCASTLAVIRRETHSWFWPAFTFVYMTMLAYAAALLTFQVGAVLTDWLT
ncbi:MAG: ferrous iron transport protein B [Gemmataceae bacterium]|jgi:ferrous iron transport protein B|uniref:Ferrous iron transport protein B n=1 Tax=Thermogemmata fonticola TaxID=2755323 RepID=A0A7V8VBW0_9BACT|nr:ferrous iron transport protein B [Thermogemmata fonticola]MBA2225169.1 ferrous iron transport protein B [Thermogemmata fonticola]MCX8140908.1 ferrous iron transport protein B [Gemmataceae bacterium]GIW84370.1 MAG: ferrous iron transport protein B [Gemmataceae bacterium]